MEFKDFVISSLSASSKIAKNNFGKVPWTLKNDYNQVLTETDEKIGCLIIKKVNENFPDFSIINEETGTIDNQSDYIWVIDPIDGTSNFAFGVPTYGILLGLLYKNVPIVGGLALPEFNEIYYAEKNKGAECNGKSVHITKETNLSRCLIAYSIDANREELNKVDEECHLAAKFINNIRSLRMSNSVFDAAMVIKGKYGASMQRTTKIWDNVAQQILIEEAGGIYTDFFGKLIDYSNPFSKIDKNFTFCMAAPEIHKKLQELIKQSI